ncbi:odorant receptor 82a-like [Anticarsia gemmatalis]|uniref:odorant receptor 82a-like n=1 Tax=Anticarsia gemmatalis TaxID=129554 RepID=UPI003F76E63F
MAKDDPDRLFECFSVLSFCVMGVFKLSSLRNNHKGWRFLLNQISKLEDEQINGRFTSDLDYQSDDEEDNNFAYYVNNYTAKFKTTSTILRRMYSFTLVIFIVSPFVEYLICIVRGMECLQYPHILPGWAPLDDISIFGYLITVSCEFLAAVFCVYVHIAFDLTSIGVMIFVCGQFSMLRDYSACIGGRGNICSITKRRDERARFRIKNCQRTNIILVSSITELDKLLKDIIGVYFFIATLTLCSLAVRLKSEEMSVMQLVSLLQYMCATLTQLLLFCRYGDAVLNESSVGMAQGPFGAAHWCLSPRIRRDLALLGIGMMRPRHLRAGPFNYLDLPSFVQIVRTAYSYYAVLGKKE